MNFPILRHKDRPYIPETGKGCPICGASFEKQGVVYLSAGAVSEIVVDEDKPMPTLEAFFYVGYHGSAVDCSDCADITVIDALEGGQFDIYFCSVQCLERFFLDIVDELKKKLNQIGISENTA
ncbi:MAG: hypothetical protein RMJ88_16370 [Thermogemmata sp.]|nr:hypothetical protein [Thermogemmata sp.]